MNDGTVSVVVDGQNISRVQSDGARPRFSVQRLERARQQILTAAPSVQLKIIVDASFRHMTLEGEQHFSRLLSTGIIEQAPAGVAADAYILQWADTHKAVVVTNDQLTPYHDSYPWLTVRGAGRNVTAMFDNTGNTFMFRERYAEPGRERDLATILNARAEELQSSAASPQAGPSGRYGQHISRANPLTCLLLIDQSHSMSHNWMDGETKMSQLARIANNAIRNLVVQATRGGDVQDYARVGVLGYGGEMPGRVTSLLPDTDVSRPFKALSELAQIARQETVTARDGTQRREISWIEPRGTGATPMSRALTEARRLIANEVQARPDAFPPVVINITDGDASDGDPINAAYALASLTTSDGNVLLFTAYIGSDGGDEILYPSSPPPALPEKPLGLFWASSVIPDVMRRAAAAQNLHLPAGARGFLYNARRDEIARLIAFGTAPRPNIQT